MCYRVSSEFFVRDQQLISVPKLPGNRETTTMRCSRRSIKGLLICYLFLLSLSAVSELAPASERLSDRKRRSLNNAWGVVKKEEAKKTEDFATVTDADDGSYCPICIEAWAKSGEHQHCFLPSGHLFGRSFI